MMELALLRLAMYEMTRREDVPYKVVINEAIELAKVFAAETATNSLNGVLDSSHHTYVRNNDFFNKRSAHADLFRMISMPLA